MDIDYSLYLVTDSTLGILGNKDLPAVVEAAIEGGVTVVQYRQKEGETADLIRMGKRLHAITQKHKVPLLINDRVDVAQVVGAEGVHVGQDDMDLQTARRILGPNAIIGVTANNLSEAVIAVSGGADYIGIGTVYATPTKENTKSIIGTAGVKNILHRLSTIDNAIPTVAIGGINISNAQRVMSQSQSPNKRLDGLAVVSAIVGAEDPKAAATALLKSIHSITKPKNLIETGSQSVEMLLSSIPTIIKEVGSKSPLCHNMTNLVVQNFAANVAVCIGASPIMANYGEEAKDLARLGGALVINMGTVTPEGIINYTTAIKAYNAIGGPVLFDPVGAGATAIRRRAVKTLMEFGYFHVIKGNENEIKTILGESTGQQRGVDSGASTSDGTEKVRIVKALATRERNVVVMTGKVDYLSDGERTYAIHNGHTYLGHITGSGCTIGTTIASFLAVHKEDMLLAALAGILMYEIAAEQAAVRDDVKGPGTFVPALLDQLYLLAADASQDDFGWLQAAKMEKL